MPKRTKDYVVSSGNVFADLGLPNPEEALAKAELAHKIALLIQNKGLTQVQTAKLLGVDQPKVSALLRGRLSGFSLERLMRERFTNHRLMAGGRTAEGFDSSQVTDLPLVGQPIG